MGSHPCSVTDGDKAAIREALTAYEALTNIEREAQKAFAFRPVVYICSPLSGDIDANQEAARRY